MSWRDLLLVFRWLTCACIAACGASANQLPIDDSPSQDEHADETVRCEDLSQLDACESRLQALELALQEHGASAADPLSQGASDANRAERCDRAADLRDRICSLASAICRLDERHPEAGIAPKCQSAEASCKRARADVDAGCPPR